jgi:crossover junction endodeoxyribonuclease RuvC
MTIRILGIDPGLEKVGFGLIEIQHSRRNAPRVLDWGVIQTSKEQSEIERIDGIYRAMGQLIQQTQPTVAAIEKIFFFRNVTTMVPVCQARGAILLTLFQAGVEFGEYTPLEVKMNLTGYGKASKQDVQAMVQQLLSLEDIPRPDDAADGLAIALCHASRQVGLVSQHAGAANRLVPKPPKQVAVARL